MRRLLLSFLTRTGAVAAIMTVFSISLALTVYLSLRNPESKVPDIKGRNRTEAEAMLGKEGLNIRVRAARYSASSNPDTIIDQSPRAGAVVKSGVTVSVVVSRVANEMEVKQVASGGANDIERPTPMEVNNVNRSLASSSPGPAKPTKPKIDSSIESDEKNSLSPAKDVSPDSPSDSQDSKEKSDTQIDPDLTERTETKPETGVSGTSDTTSSGAAKSVEKKEVPKDEQKSIKPSTPVVTPVVPGQTRSTNTDVTPKAPN
ncbi:MAG: PASTA domain-containing protein [Pyrinomonadaceae bacterium]